MWLKVTLENGTDTLIDVSKVQQINAHQRGSQVFFTSITEDSAKKRVVRSIVIRETLDKLARPLKVKFIS